MMVDAPLVSMILESNPKELRQFIDDFFQECKAKQGCRIEKQNLSTYEAYYDYRNIDTSQYEYPPHSPRLPTHVIILFLET